MDSADLFIGGSVILTDIHDGRKKVYLSLPKLTQEEEHAHDHGDHGHSFQMKLGISDLKNPDDMMHFAFKLEDATTR